MNDISYEHTHMCRITISHTVCIWINHIFDTNFKISIPLNTESLKIYRSIGMHDECFIHLNIHANNDVNEGNYYIECWEFIAFES